MGLPTCFLDRSSGRVVMPVADSAHAGAYLKGRTLLPATMLDAMPAGIAVLDPAGRIVAVNETWRRFADDNGGRDPNHFLGWDYLAQCERVCAGSSDAPTALAAAQGLRSVLTGESPSFQQIYPCDAPGRPRWMRMRARGFDDRRRRSVAVVHEDITPRVSAEFARDHQLALLRAIFESVLDAIVTIDERGTVTAINAATTRLFGYEEHELIGRNVSILMPQPHRARHHGYIERYIRTGQAHIIGTGRDVEGQHRDGTRFPVRLQVSEARVGERRFFTGVLHDLTAQRAAEADRLAQAQRELVVRELGHRIKNVFATVASVAHLLSRTTDSVAEYHAGLTSRLRSLAATQALLTEGIRGSIMLDELVAFELAPYLADGRVVDVAGGAVRLSAQAGQLLGMAIHELATNASKYGALSRARGELSVRWRLARRRSVRMLEIKWAERGGPPAAPSTRRGFGSTLIERSLRSGLSAEVVLDYAVEGLRCDIRIPFDKVADLKRDVFQGGR